MESTQSIPKVYDAFITMGELMAHPVGCQFAMNMAAQYQPPALSEEEKARLLDDEENQEDISMDYAAMGMDMPLTKVADMSGGAFTDEMVNGLVQQLNQQ